MAKSKLARRVRKLRNLKGTYFTIRVQNKGHWEALKRAHKKAGYKLDTDPRFSMWDEIENVEHWVESNSLYVINYNSAKGTGVYNHDGCAPCVKL